MANRQEVVCDYIQDNLVQFGRLRHDVNYDTWWEDGNVISNTTWFDYSGYPLKALWSELASQVTPSGIECQEPKAKSQKFLRNGQLFIIRDGKMYNVQGAQVK